MLKLDNFKNEFKTLGESIKLEEGTIIQFQEDEVEKIYFIEKGKTTVSHYHIDGKENRLEPHREGDFIGIEYVYDGGISQYQVTASTRLSVICFKRAVFQRFIMSDPHLNQYIFEYVLKKLRLLQTFRTKSHVLSKRGLVASEIKRMAKETDNGYSNVIFPKPVFSDMAIRLGVARETVSRAVSEMVRSNIIENQKSMLLVKDAALLENIIR